MESDGWVKITPELQTRRNPQATSGKHVSRLERRMDVVYVGTRYVLCKQIHLVLPNYHATVMPNTKLLHHIPNFKDNQTKTV